jgi:pimeloyl-ACP methyl ester carboxylesterase
VTEFLSAGSHRLEIETIVGRANAPTMVFLHEGLGSIALWRDFPHKLAAATGVPALVYSRYGYGKSDPLRDDRAVDYMHVEALTVLPELRYKLGLDDVVLVGHSDGASIALIHAGAGKWPVRGLIVEAPHVFVEDISIAAITAAKHDFESGDLSSRLARYHADCAGAFWGWNKIWLEPEFRGWNITEYLPGVRCPVLAIQGADDEYGTLAQLDAVMSGVSGPTEKMVLPDCGHSPHREKTAATLAAITRWWRDPAHKFA